MTLLLTVILVALIFEYINGFHDTANSIATVVSTKVLTPRQAVVLAAITNLLGALWGTAVAKTISSGLLDAKLVAMTSDVMICALLGGIVWNLITWWFGLPSSSSHALIGGLCGAALAASGNNWHVIVWSQPNPQHWYQGKGLLWKVVVPMVTSPVAGLILGFLVMALLYVLLRNARPPMGQSLLRPGPDAQRRRHGLYARHQRRPENHGHHRPQPACRHRAGQLDSLPGWLSFLHTPEPAAGKDMEIAVWIKVVCALTMAAGTAAGGWRIIKTLGHKMVKLHPVNGFAAETSSAAVILAATHLGIPVSTTHNISAAIMGVGAARRLNAIKWRVVERMVWAWLLTIPVSGLLAYGCVRLLRSLG